MTLKDDLSHEKFMREQFEQSVHNLLARAEAAEARAADAEIRAKSWHDSSMTLADQRDAAYKRNAELEAQLTGAATVVVTLTQERDEAQRMIATLQGELNKALALIEQLESDINSLFEPDDPPSEPYSEMDLLQREAAGLP